MGKIKLKTLIVNKKTIIVFFLLIVFVALICLFSDIVSATSPKTKYTIVIDAGHGGRDGGAVGISTGITESELNLKYAKKLQEVCQEFGIRTIMTRNDMEGLYDDFAENKKKSEMENRKNIINSSGADVMVSLHMNSFPLSNCSGAQIFYAKGSDVGFKLAKSVQQAICKEFKNAREYVTVGDYFVLNYSTIPAILIECGFLSNPEEEKNLQSDEYCQKFCYNILAGLISFFKL